MSLKGSNDYRDMLGLGVFQLIFSRAKSVKNLVAGVIFAGVIIVTSFGAAELSKILLRNNFGKKGISWEWGIVGLLPLLGLGIFSLLTGIEGVDGKHHQYGVEGTYIPTGVFFISLVFIGAYQIFKVARSEPYQDDRDVYEGDSVVLRWLIKGGWSPSEVQNVAEPLLLIALGFFLLPINQLLGYPFLFCALSIWLKKIVDAIRGVFAFKNKVANEGYVHSDNDDDFVDVYN